MKKSKLLVCISTVSAVIAGAVPFSANAESSTILYGKMNIPYADFYSAEFGESPNAYKVDAFTSATTAKWAKNGEGELFSGTFNQPNEDGTGAILGVSYPVAITQKDLESLGDNNFNFIPLESEPSAYKTVTVTDGKASFSAVQDNSPEIIPDSSIKLNTDTPWGDYLIETENLPEGAIYGALIKTDDGNTYAMRHEENIWRGELAWSSGITTTEPHGNILSYENFQNLMGATINEVVFIMDDGYKTVKTDTYIPVKFSNEINIENSAAGTGKTSLKLTGFPEDFVKTYSVDGEGFSVSDSEISYTDAMAGQYTLTISDSSKIYADITAEFILSTDVMPAEYSDGKLVKSQDFTDEEFKNFIKNVSVVTVNGKDYKSSGKGSVKIIDEDGSINFNASSKDIKIFDENDNYTIKIVSTGYNTPLEFSIAPETPSDTEPATESQQNNSNTTAKSSAAQSSGKTTAKNTSQNDSPKTGVNGIAVPTIVSALAVMTVVSLRKKNK